MKKSARPKPQNPARQVKASPQTRAEKKPLKSTPPSKLKLLVESVAFGGDGIARHEGKVVFIKDALPGEEVLVELITDKERFARAKILERLIPAPYLETNPCKYADRCGGCQWLSVPYPTQLAWKKSFIEAALSRIAKADLSLTEIQMVPSPAQAGYRNRIKLKLHILTDGSLEMGYYAGGTHELVPIERCFVAAEPINEILGHLQKLKLNAPAREAWYELELQEVSAGVTATFLGELGDLPRPQLMAQFAEATASEKALFWVRPGDEARLWEVDQGLDYWTFGGQFQQVNREANRQLRAWVLAKVLELKAQTVLDLYCGSGNFSLSLLPQGIKVWGIELAPQAIACAQENLRRNQLDGGAYAESAVEAEKIEAQFPALKPGAVDLLIADPPRSGMAEALPFLKQLGPEHILYISCDPNTLARDLRQLLESYRIESIQGLDFFPNSYHVETVVQLRRTTVFP